jgi:hypothetical protein
LQGEGLFKQKGLSTSSFAHLAKLYEDLHAVRHQTRFRWLEQTAPFFDFSLVHVTTIEIHSKEEYQ